jgi:lysozyme
VDNTTPRNTLEQLLRDEGFRPYPYKDTRGFSTVGVGHNLDAHPLPNETYPMSLERAKEVLADDVARIWAELQGALPWVVTLPDAICGCLKNLAFNMGIGGLLEFRHMLADVHAGEYAAAATEMQHSLWYSEVGDRAKRLVKQMQAGEWQ